jgi:hypothetical protein
MTKQIKEGLADLADRAERDHEVQMARSDLYKLAKYAIKLHDMLKNVSEAEGIEGWQQAKITKAADYISSVYHAMDYDMAMEPPAVAETVKTRRFKPALSEDEYEGYKGNLKAKFMEKKATKVKEDDDPCWDGYEMIGMKKKGGKEVPNCVPKKK